MKNKQKNLWEKFTVLSISLWNSAKSRFIRLNQDAKYFWEVIWRQSTSYGNFSPSEPEVKLLSDGHNIKLSVDMTYTDPDKKNWFVPKSKDDNDIFDGASIPSSLWSIIGSPWVGKYRNASIIHDYFCKNHSGHWRDVHRMFYYGCLAGGVYPSKAKLMFTAVYTKGPRW
jgi:hypothetical protein